MSQTTYRCGIIGAGFIGVGAVDSHELAYKENPRCDFVGWYDKLPTRSSYGSIVELIRNCDIVSVCTPPETHEEIVIACAPYVKAIWCEKPISSYIVGAEQMIQVCNQCKTLLVINHQREFVRPVFRFKRDTEEPFRRTTHVFSTLLSLFKNVRFVYDQLYCDGNPVDLEETDEQVFEFDVAHNKERMLPKVLDYIVECLDKGEWYKGNAYKALQVLKLCHEYAGVKSAASNHRP